MSLPGFICLKLESDQAVGSDPDVTFKVIKYRMALVNKNDPDKIVRKESSFCTGSLNDEGSAVKFMVPGMLDQITFECDILDIDPHFNGSNREVSCFLLWPAFKILYPLVIGRMHLNALFLIVLHCIRVSTFCLDPTDY